MDQFEIEVVLGERSVPTQVSYLIPGPGVALNTATFHVVCIFPDGNREMFLTLGQDHRPEVLPDQGPEMMVIAIERVRDLDSVAPSGSVLTPKEIEHVGAKIAEYMKPHWGQELALYQKALAH